MKKIVCLVLALLLCVTATAFAEYIPSRTTADLIRFDVVAENQPGDADIYLMPVNEATVGEMLPEYQARIDVCQTEIDKLAAGPDVSTYFEGATYGWKSDTDGEEDDDTPVDLHEMLGLEPDAILNVFEFCPTIAGGFQEDCGVVTATMLFSTPYKKDEKVAVMVGVVEYMDEDGEMHKFTPEEVAQMDLAELGYTQVVTWQAFEGIGLDAVEEQDETYGAVRVEFTPEIVNAIQNEMTLMAVVSGPTEEQLAEEQPEATPTVSPR